MTAMPTPAAGRTQAAFGIQQEHTGRDDPLAFFKPRADLNAIG